VTRPETLPSFDAMQQRMWTGDLNLKDNDTKVAYAWAHWGRLQENLRTERFRESMRAIAAC
jgi:hypothetical protein